MSDTARQTTAPYFIALTRDDGSIRSLAEIVADVAHYAVEIAPNKSEAARALGIGRSRLYRKLRSFDLDDSEAA